MSELEKDFKASEVFIDETASIILQLNKFSKHPGIINLSEQLIMIDAYRKEMEKVYFDENESLKSRDFDIINTISSLYENSKTMYEIAIEARLDLLK